MSDLDQYYTALRNADAAGDVEGARKLAAHIKTLQSQSAQQATQEAPQQAKPTRTPSVLDAIYLPNFGLSLGNARDMLGGGVLGAGDIGATLTTAADTLQNLSPANLALRISQKGVKEGLKSAVTDPMQKDAARREDMTGALEDMGVDTSSLPFRGARLGANVAGTAGSGSLVTGGARAMLPAALATRAAPVLSAIESGGMTAGGAGLGTRMLGGAVNGAVSSALIDPRQADKGAIIGAGLPPAVRLLAAGGNTIRNMMVGQNGGKDLATKAINEYGIPLGVADITGSPTVKATRSILNDAPIIGGVGAKQKEAVQEAFNKAVGGTFGADATKLTPEVLDAAKSKMGAEFDRLWNRNALQVDGGFMQKITALERQADKLPKNEAQSLKAEINDLYSKIGTDEAGNPIIAGDVANKFQSYLRRRAESSSGLKNELSDLRQNIISTFNRSIAPADAAALTLNRSQYKAFKTVEPLLNKGEVGVAGREAGDIPASLLPNAVASNYSSAAGTPLADLAKIGSKFLVDRVAKTGGSQRALLQNGMLGGAFGAGAVMNPSLLFAAPAAYGLNGLLGNPAIAKAVVNAKNGGLLGSVNPELLQMMYQSAPALSANR